MTTSTATALAAAQLYRAEQALHDAHQTHVDAWITAAADRLHEAVEHYFAAEKLGPRSGLGQA